MSNREDLSPAAGFSLYDTEERVLEEAERMLRRLDEMARGVRSLAHAYRQSYREQRRLVKVSDRMQRELQNANQRLADQGADLQQLNQALAAEIEQRLQLSEELRKMASVDSLTGALTRHRLFEVAKQEIFRHEQTGAPLAILMIDLDDFKRINDTLGHVAGDEALRYFADLSRAALRDSDVLGRLGGEEFVILLPNTPIERAAGVAERLRLALADKPLPLTTGSWNLTASMGVVLYRRTDGSLADALIRADRALYAAKRAGRNRSVALDE